MQVTRVAAHSRLLGKKRKVSEMTNGGPTIPSDLPQLAPADNTPIFFPEKAEVHNYFRHVKAVQGHRHKKKKQREEVAALKQDVKPMPVEPPARSSVPPTRTCPVIQRSTGPETRKGGPSAPSKAGASMPSTLPQLATCDSTPMNIPIQQAICQGLTMGWNVLPSDVEEHILCSVPLLQLARVSTTCRAFHACFCRRMAEQDRGRCDMAASCFGSKRIQCIAGLVSSFLKGEPMDHKTSKHLYANTCCISADGVLQVDGPVSVPMIAKPTCEAGEVLVSVISGVFLWLIPGHFRMSFGDVMNHMVVHVISPNQSRVRLSVDRLHNLVTINLSPSGDEDMESMAFVQALLMGLSAPSLDDAHTHIDIQLHVHSTKSDGLVSQILPILPLVARHKWRIGWLVEGQLMALP